MLSVYLVLSSFIVSFVFSSDNKNSTMTIVSIDDDNISDTSDAYGYCSHPDCSLKNQHTMCIAASKQSPRLFASGMTTWMRYQIMLLHNRHRDNIAMGLEAGQPPATNMRKMYWDYELEKMAEVWARQCQKRHDECRNTIRFNVLQNMDVRPVVARVTEAQLLADAVGAWFSGSRVLPPEHVWSFRLGNCSATSGCNSHWYSAAAWASTWRIGCSQSLCTAKKRSCVLFRKKRRRSAKNPPADSSDNETVAATDDQKNILRRTRLAAPSKSQRFEDYASTLKPKSKDSPLHRGMMDIIDKDSKQSDLKIIAYTFCNYGPAGNIDGFPIYEAGATCSNCPQGTHCGDRTHRALCAIGGDPDVGQTRHSDLRE